MPGPPLIGLTGGIASGKSAVSAQLRDLGVTVIDADQLARDVVAPGQPALEDIRTRFGASVFTDGGSLDRKELAELVFADEEARRALNAITHPRIAEASRAAIANAFASGADLVVYEAPLLVENKLHLAMSALIVVATPESEQLKRLMARDSLTEAEALSRIRSQLPLAEKRALADYVIDNSGTLKELKTTVDRVWKQVVSAHAPPP